MKTLHDHPWEVSYKTSGTRQDGTPVDILHDFYIPALERSLRYDRVAGYFRSSSLAAASQGFSAFTGNEGRIRLIVGCDMDPADILIILNKGKIEGTEVEKFMVGQVSGDAAWPEDVRRGAELLGWMVQRGCLDLRVAFRVHRSTGKPIAVDSTHDGYVHEKWALFYGAEEECMAASGSLNESRQALERNAENLDVFCEWHGGRDAERVRRYREDFERLWRNEHPAFVIHSLPEAVRQELVRLGSRVNIPLEIDGTSAQPPPNIEPPSLEERFRMAVIRDAPRMPNGKFVGLYTAPVEPWPHQEVVAQRLIRSWPFNHLLCDEVGLGKTIEAGLAIRSLHLCGLAERILIAAPASLCQQWQREMASKFLMPFARATSREKEWVFPDEHSAPSASLLDERLTIVSTALLTRKDRAGELTGAEGFDIALVDEAHYARRSNLKQEANERVHPEFNRLFGMIRDRLRKKARSLWLATATPMQLDRIEVADLISLTGRVGSFQFDPTLTQGFYDILAKLVRGATPHESEWAFLRTAILALQTLDPLLWDYLNSTVVDGPIRSSVRGWLERGRLPRGNDLARIRRFVFAASPLARVMLRHTRRLLEIYREKGQLNAKLARRTILPLPQIIFNAEEKKVYDQLEIYCEGLKKQIERNNRDRGRRVAMGFYLSFLRLRFASSLRAIRETLKRRRLRVLSTLGNLEEEGEAEVGEDLWRQLLDSESEREEVETIGSFLKGRTERDLKWELAQVESLLETLESLVERPTKMKELFRVIGRRRDNRTSRIQQTVIFSRFFDTVEEIRDLLRDADPNMLIGLYSGQGAGGQYVEPQTKRLVHIDREIVKHRFVRGEIDVLICTDAAAEGLNLQTADFLINFDLPWNPMKVEQRIGRIDRIGQRHDDIFVLNLAYADSAEQIVYDRLLARLQQAGAIVGVQQISLLPVTVEEFQELAEGTLSPEKLEARALVRLEGQRIREQSTQIPADELFDLYNRLADEFRATKLPVALADIESAIMGSDYLKRIGCLPASDDAGNQWIALHGLPGIPDGTRLTVSRTLREAGLPDGSSARFASFGEPAFHALMERFLADDMPPCIRRIESPAQKDLPSLVAYAVATSDGEIRLITGVNDLSGLQLDPECILTDESVAPLVVQLGKMAEKEWASHIAGPALAALNEKVGKAQVALATMVASDLVSTKAHYSSEPQFWPLLSQLDDLANSRDAIAIKELKPLELLQAIESDVLFPVTVPQLSSHGHMTAPRILVRSAIDTACRTAESLKISRTDCTVERVVARLGSEALDFRKLL
jgi:superfamily II DNA or RNA helicase